MPVAPDAAVADDVFSFGAAGWTAGAELVVVLLFVAVAGSLDFAAALDDEAAGALVAAEVALSGAAFFSASFLAGSAVAPFAGAASFAGAAPFVAAGVAAVFVSWLKPALGFRNAALITTAAKTTEYLANFDLLFSIVYTSAKRRSALP